MSRNANYDFAEHAKGLLRKEKPQTNPPVENRRNATKTAKKYYHPDVYEHLKGVVAEKMKAYGK